MLPIPVVALNVVLPEVFDPAMESNHHASILAST